MYRSSDGGKTFKEINTPHGDHHDLWIDPENADRMIVADDGGAQISFDGAITGVLITISQQRSFTGFPQIIIFLTEY